MDMKNNSQNAAYQHGLELAEQGRHGEALQIISEHLETFPRDIEALNDKGAVLYCMGRTDEAIDQFHQARQVDESCPQVYWNLAEAYLGSDQPSQARHQFEKMAQLDILSCDLLNRTANAFLQQEEYHAADEMLEWSLKISPDQEILNPIRQIVKSKTVQP